MSTPTRPSLFQRFWQANNNPAARPDNNATPAHATDRYHVPGEYPESDGETGSTHEDDRFESSPVNDTDAIHLKLADLRSREEHLNYKDAVLLCDLNDAQRLQRDIEQGKLADKDIREAVRLAHWRKAFATPGFVQAQHPGDEFSRNHQTRTDSTNNATSSSGTDPVHHNMPGVPMSLNELYGRDLSRITMQQGDNHTCYLLSAFDSIFKHPQGQRLLSQIQVNQVRDGYLVKFPGQPKPIAISRSALQGNRVPNFSKIGPKILWCAYLNTPGASPVKEGDNSTAAMTRIFGRDRVESIYIPINEVTQIRNTQTDHIDLLTALQVGGNHYFAVYPNAEQTFKLIDPRNSDAGEEFMLDGNTLVEEFNPELTRIRL